MTETKTIRHGLYLPGVGLVLLPNTARIEYLLQHKPIVPKEYTMLQEVIITALVVMLSGLFGLLFGEPGLPSLMGLVSAIVMVFVWIIRDQLILERRDRRFLWECEVYDECCKHTQPKKQSKPRRSWTADEKNAILNGTPIEKGETLFKNFAKPCKGDNK